MKLFVRTFGCQMNVHDSTRIAHLMKQNGYEICSDAMDADVIVVNTCSVREKAWHKAVSEVGRICARGRRKKEKIIVVAGCVAEQEKERWFKELFNIDLVVGPDHYGKLPTLIKHIQGGGKAKSVTGFDDGRPEDFLTVFTDDVDQSVAQFVTVMKGCKECCNYCIVPSVRGPERCRPADDIVGEVETLCQSGVKEVMLLGQKVNAYEYGDISFADLIEKLDKVSLLERLRFTSPHPRHMTGELIGLFGKLGSLCEAIHLPVQSGSNKTLKRMGRRYTADFYREVVDSLREKCPEIMISTDLIVGYPGESEEDFGETIKLLEDIRFSGVFSFKYSPRPGTVAARLEDDVEDEEKKRRLKRVHDVTTDIEKQIRAAFVGSKLQVLIEGEGRNPNQFSGRARNNQIVNFIMPSGVKLEDVRGDLVEVEIIRSLPHSLEGTLD